MDAGGSARRLPRLRARFATAGGGDGDAERDGGSAFFLFAGAMRGGSRGGAVLARARGVATEGNERRDSRRSVAPKLARSRRRRRAGRRGLNRGGKRSLLRDTPGSRGGDARRRQSRPRARRRSEEKKRRQLVESFARKAQRRILGDSSPRVVRKALRFGLNARVRERDDRERARRLGAGRARASGANTPRGPRVGRHFSNSHADLATAAGNLPKWRLADAPRARANARVATRERSRGVGGDPNAGERSRGVVRGRVGTRARVGLRGKRQNIPQKETALSVQAKKLGGKVRDFFQPAQFAKSKCADATHSRVVEEETLAGARECFLERTTSTRDLLNTCVQRAPARAILPRARGGGRAGASHPRATRAMPRVFLSPSTNYERRMLEDAFDRCARRRDEAWAPLPGKSRSRGPLRGSRALLVP